MLNNPEDMAKKSIPIIIRETLSLKNKTSGTSYEIMISNKISAGLLLAGGAWNLIGRLVLLSEPLGSCIDETLILFISAFIFLCFPKMEKKILIAPCLQDAFIYAITTYIILAFYKWIGPAVWTFALLQLASATFKKCIASLYGLSIVVLLSSVYTVYKALNSPQYVLSLTYFTIQGIFLCLAIFLLIRVHELNLNKHIVIKKRIEDEISSKVKMEILYKQLALSEAEITKTLENLKATQQQLIQQEKMAGIGHLAAGVAHEINSPLGFVSSNFEVSKEYYEIYKKIRADIFEFINKIRPMGGEDLAVAIEELRTKEQEYDLENMTKDWQCIFNDNSDGLMRIQSIVKGLKMFSRTTQEGELDDYDLNEGIKNTVLLAKNEIKADVIVTLDLADIPVFKANGSQINQVLLNLVVNAVHAIRVKSMNTTGNITIKTSYSEGLIYCSISNDGETIPKELLQKIFNPFFTTKPIGQGTGLGLSIAYDIINAHKGEIKVQSEEGRKTKFTIKIPYI